MMNFLKICGATCPSVCASSSKGSIRDQRPTNKKTEQTTSEVAKPIVVNPTVPTVDAVLVGPSETPVVVPAPATEPAAETVATAEEKEESQVEVKSDEAKVEEPVSSPDTAVVEAIVPFKPGKVSVSDQVKNAFEFFIARKPKEEPAPAPVVEASEQKTEEAKTEESVSPTDLTIDVEQKNMEIIEAETLMAKQKQSMIKTAANAVVNGTVGTAKFVISALTDPTSISIAVAAVGGAVFYNNMQ